MPAVMIKMYMAQLGNAATSVQQACEASGKNLVTYRDQATVQATVSLLTTAGTKTATANYLTSVAENQTDFDKDYANIIAEVNHVSSAIAGLNASIASLQADIAANNSAVLDTAVDTTGKVLVQGVTAAGSAATDNPAGAVVAGITGITDYAKGLIKVIELNEKTVDDLVQIRKLALQVSADEISLMILLGIGTMLGSLGGTRGLQLDIVGDVFDYWGALDEGIQDLFDNHGDNLSGQIDLVNFSPTTEKFKNPAFPPWNVVQPVAHASKVFQAVATTTPQYWPADGVEFTPLGSTQSPNDEVNVPSNVQ